MWRHLADLGRRLAGWGKEAEGTDFLHMNQDPPGAPGGVGEVQECQTFHSSELASQPLPERKIRERNSLRKERFEKEQQPWSGKDQVWIPALQPVGCVFSC